ncbi:MAG: NAD-dependent epimerase/dehydratase family protein, partial [Gammaproteobacteria bacterium]|nr:NAD-dependent epimerase/dehydratase family protein [Gammaproteobacteria bacterium]
IYGQPSEIPLPEEAEKLQLSPYGLEKQVDEEYADLFARVHGLSALGQRYFNVYGPRQDPKSPYAGVIALFVDRIVDGQGITVYGYGYQSRDFIYVDDVARANLAALEGNLTGACNIGTGEQSTLLDLIEDLSQITGTSSEVSHEPAREGDIRYSLANVTKMNQQLGVKAQTSMHDGLQALLDYSKHAS